MDREVFKLGWQYTKAHTAQWSTKDILEALNDGYTDKLSGDNDSYQASILKHPDDIRLRLVYAGWLDRKRDPRGEFIRVQCHSEQRADDPLKRLELQTRETQLLDEHQHLWSYNVSRSADSWRWRRGFIDRIELIVGCFKSLQQLLYLFPVEHLFLLGSLISVKPLISALAHCVELERLRSFEFNEGRYAVGVRELSELLASPYLRNLCHLGLHGNALGAEGVARIAASANLSQLKSLSLSGYGFDQQHHINNEGLEFILESPYLEELDTLMLSGCYLDDRCCHLLTTSPQTANFIHLDLSDNYIGDVGLARLIKSGQLRTIKTLNLQNNAISTKAKWEAKEHFGTVLII